MQNDVAAHDAADARRTELISARDVAQIAIASAKAELAALLTEQSALQRSLTKGQGDKAIDRITVKPGYERALAAALGDDADASIGGETGRRWLGGTTPMSKLANDALIQFVDAPPELAARLSMVRVVETDDGKEFVMCNLVRLHPHDVAHPVTGKMYSARAMVQMYFSG